MSFKLKFLPPDILLNILVVACHTFVFLIFAETTLPINGAATLTAGLGTLFPAACVPPKLFGRLVLIDHPSSLN